MRVGFAVCLLAGGCDWIFAIEPPPEIPTCAGPFGTKRQLADVGVQVAAVSLAGDELWLAAGEDERQLRRAHFDGAAIAALEAVPFGMAGADERDVTLARDGELVLFLSNRSGGTRVHETRRSSSGFAAPVEPAGIVDQHPITTIDVSFDGLTLYWSNFFDELWTARRPDVDAPFANVTRVLGISDELAADELAISSDELELYTSSFASGIARRTRAHRDEAFGEPEQLTSGSAPDLSPDGRTLIFVDDGRLWLMERDCR